MLSAGEEETDFSLYGVQHHRLGSRAGSSLAGNPRVELSGITDQHACDAGKWINKEGETIFRNNPFFSGLKQRHKAVHLFLQLKEVYAQRQALQCIFQAFF